MEVNGRQTRALIVGRPKTRDVIAYLAVVLLETWAFYIREDIGQGGDLVRSPGAAIAALLAFGLGPAALLAIVQVPAMVVTIELVHRFRADSLARRSIVGAASWAAWGLFVAVTLAIASQLVVVPETVVVDVALLAASGAAYGLVAFDGPELRPGKVLAASALAVTVLVIFASAWMAGRWGGTA